jgi:hypothetical protein
MSDELPTTPGSAAASSASPITFTAFVLSLMQTAAVHFGDRDDPVSGARQAPNLPLARHMIDVLAMLAEKTRGNLTAEERQLLEGGLAALGSRYLELSRGAAATGSRGSQP